MVVCRAVWVTCRSDTRAPLCSAVVIRHVGQIERQATMQQTGSFLHVSTPLALSCIICRSNVVSSLPKTHVLIARKKDHL